MRHGAIQIDGVTGLETNGGIETGMNLNLPFEHIDELFTSVPNEFTKLLK